MPLFSRRRANSTGNAALVQVPTHRPQSTSRPVSRQRNSIRGVSPPRSIASNWIPIPVHHAPTPEAQRQQTRQGAVPGSRAHTRSYKYASQLPTLDYLPHSSHTKMYDHPQHRAIDVVRDHHHRSPTFEPSLELKHRPRSYSHGIPPIRAGGAEPTPFPTVKPPYGSGAPPSRPKTPSGMFSALKELARGRSKSRGNHDENIERPRSRSNSAPDHPDRGRGRDGYPDPKYEKDIRREKLEAQKRYELDMLQSLENTLRIQESEIRHHARRGSDATHAPRQDISRSARDRGRVDPREYYANSPATLTNTVYNAHQLQLRNEQLRAERPPLAARQTVDIPYAPIHHAAPLADPRTLRRAATAMGVPHVGGHQLPAIPHGWFNSRGDQVLDRHGREIIMLPKEKQWPPHMAHLPPPGRGWGDNQGQLLDDHMQWVRKIG